MTDDERDDWLDQQAAKAAEEHERSRARYDGPLSAVERARLRPLAAEALDALADEGREDPLAVGPGPAAEYVRAEARHRLGVLGPRLAETKRRRFFRILQARRTGTTRLD